MKDSLIIKNGLLYDPLSGIDGEKKEIAIKDGVVVDKVDASDAKVIDASGMIIMPGGVDIHSHIAGAKVNTPITPATLPIEIITTVNTITPL